MARNGIIGRDGRLPWHLPEDLKHFKRTTMGHHIVMGRRTWESIGRPLPGRHSIVLSGDPAYQKSLPKEVQAATSLDEAIATAQSTTETKEIFIIGGAGVYQAAFPQAQRFHLTRVHADIKGDTVLQGFDESQWREVNREDHSADLNNPYDYSICLLEKAR